MLNLTRRNASQAVSAKPHPRQRTLQPAPHTRRHLEWRTDKWSVVSGCVLARFPALLFGFDAARKLATAAMGDSECGCSTPSPRSARCSACDPRCRADAGRQDVLLVMRAPSQPLKLLQHLRECHVGPVVAGCVCLCVCVCVCVCEVQCSDLQPWYIVSPKIGTLMGLTGFKA